MNYAWLADLVVAIHLAYAGFVLFGFLAILLGAMFHWSWPLNPTFRSLHLACIVLVAVESVWGATCPLTALENYLLRAGEQANDQPSFIGRLMSEVLYYDVPEETFTILYCLLATAALLAYCSLHRQLVHSVSNRRKATPTVFLKRLWRRL